MPIKVPSSPTRRAPFDKREGENFSSECFLGLAENVSDPTFCALPSHLFNFLRHLTHFVSSALLSLVAICSHMIFLFVAALSSYGR
jgi:hypothetical protein